MMAWMPITVVRSDANVAKTAMEDLASRTRANVYSGIDIKQLYVGEKVMGIITAIATALALLTVSVILDAASEDSIMPKTHIIIDRCFKKGYLHS